MHVDGNVADSYIHHPPDYDIDRKGFLIFFVEDKVAALGREIWFETENAGALRWEENGIDYDPLFNCGITVDDNENVAKNQDLDFNPWNMFLIRAGFTGSVVDLGGPEAFRRLKHRITSVHGSDETARWFWNKRFAAVASDTPAFEAYPPTSENESLKRPDGFNKFWA